MLRPYHHSTVSVGAMFMLFERTIFQKDDLPLTTAPYEIDLFALRNASTNRCAWNGHRRTFPDG